MKKYLKFIPHLVLGYIIILIFRSWFSLDLITSGDFSSFTKSQYETKPLFLYAWNLSSASEMGGFVGPLLWIHLNIGIPLTIFGSWFGLSWEIIQRVYYLFPFLIITLFSSHKLFCKLFPNNKLSLLSSVIYLLNTYILMVIGGGQIPGIGMAYSLLPFVIYAFLNIFEKLEDKSYLKLFYHSLISSLVFALQLIFDIRIGYITLVAVLVFWIMKVIKNINIRFVRSSFIFVFLIPGTFVVLLHFFWILPTVLSRGNLIDQFGPVYSTIDAVRFFSFATLENSISLLHPNWPENLFGKVGFMRTEFLFLPIFAYSSLLFLLQIKDLRTGKYILYFALLGLIGAFLAKGANEPFGQTYLWMFDHFPGFIMFRDPTKWYALVAVSYSMLIPFTIWKIYGLLKSQPKFQKHIPGLFLILTSTFLIFIIRPAVFGKLDGTYKTSPIPREYINLEIFLSSQERFYRTLWVPNSQRFSYYSNLHPILNGNKLFKDASAIEMVEKLKTGGNQKFLEEAVIRYIIVPFDNKEEIFLKDRKYDEKLYLETTRNIQKISWLKQHSGFGKIAVFEVPNPKDHFWTTSKSLLLSYKYISPVEYEVSVRNARIGDTIVFSESYDAKWFAREKSTKLYDFPNLISSNPHNRIFNSFTLRKAGNYTLSIYYYPQIYVNIGIAISVLSLITVISILIYLRKKK